MAKRPQTWDKGSVGRKPPGRLPVTKWSSDCPSRQWQGPATRGSIGQQPLFYYLVLTQNTGSQTASQERIIYSFIEPSSPLESCSFGTCSGEPALGWCWGHRDKEETLPWGGGVVHSFSGRQRCRQIKMHVLRFLRGYFHTSLQVEKTSSSLAGVSRFC